MSIIDKYSPVFQLSSIFLLIALTFVVIPKHMFYINSSKNSLRPSPTRTSFFHQKLTLCLSPTPLSFPFQFSFDIFLFVVILLLFSTYIFFKTVHAIFCVIFIVKFSVLHSLFMTEKEKESINIVRIKIIFGILFKAKLQSIYSKYLKYIFLIHVQHPYPFFLSY